MVLNRIVPAKDLPAAARTITVDDSTVDLIRAAEFDDFREQVSVAQGTWYSTQNPASVTVSADYGSVTKDTTLFGGQGGRWTWTAPRAAAIDVATHTGHEAPATITVTVDDGVGTANVVVTLNRIFIPTVEVGGADV